MHDMLAAAPLDASPPTADARLVRLSRTHPGHKGVIADVRAEHHARDHGLDVDELQRRLLEFGFVEGAVIEVLHQGAIGGDPIAVRLDDMRVALRRRDAEDVWVLLDTSAI